MKTELLDCGVCEIRRDDEIIDVVPYPQRVTSVKCPEHGHLVFAKWHGRTAALEARNDA